MFAKTANFVMKHSKAIIVVWIVILLCLTPLMLKSGDNLQYDMTKMSGVDTEATDGQKIIKEYYGGTINLEEILVITYENETSYKQALEVVDRLTVLLLDKYEGSILTRSFGEYSKESSGYPGAMMIAVSSNDKNISMIVETGNIRDLVSQAKGDANVSAYVTGSAAITYDTMVSSTEDVKKVDPLSIALILVLLGLFFCAIVTAIVPPMVVGVAYGISLAGIYAVSCMFDVFYITKILVLVTMLGAGCDYALFIVSRYRDERKKGDSHNDALKTAIMWAGESVFTSGLSVIIGFGALSLCTFSLVQSMGMILAMGIVIALIAALTLIPSILNLIGEKVFLPYSIEKYKQVDTKERNGAYSKICHLMRRYFGWVSHVTQHHAKAIVVVAIVAMAPAIYVCATSEESSDMISIMPKSESIDGLNAIMDNAEGGMIMPTFVVLNSNLTVFENGEIEYLEYHGHTMPYIQWSGHGQIVIKHCAEISEEIKSKYGIRGTGIVSDTMVNGPTQWSAAYDTVETMLKVLGKPYDPLSVNTAICANLPPAIQSTIAEVLSTEISTGKTFYDVRYDEVILKEGTSIHIDSVLDYYLNYATGLVSDDGNYVSIMIVTTEKPMSDNTMTFLNSLKEDFHGEGGFDADHKIAYSKSYVAGTSAIMNDISKEVSAQFDIIGLIVIIALIILLFFILGSYISPIRSILTIILSIIVTVGLTHYVFGTLLSIPVVWLIPIVLFVVLLGLGMDYDIFLTTRIREGKLKGMDNHEAISHAVREAGPVTSLCSLIMGGTFLTMLLTGSSMLQEFGFALGVGILFEGLFMVGFVVPALMHLMGDWSWKGPAFLKSRRDKI